MSFDDVFYIRYKKKPKTFMCDSRVYKKIKGLYAYCYDEEAYNLKITHEISWQLDYFKNDDKLFKMIKTNDKKIAEEILHSKIVEAIKFLAKEILNGNELVLIGVENCK